MDPGADAIVIGAGLGGLFAAARLAARGLRTLVLEKSPHPGGTAYVFQRRGFSFPMGPMGFSSPKLVRGLLHEAGCEEVPAMVRANYRVVAFGLEVPVSRSFEAVRNRLAQAAPADARGVEEFFHEVERIARAMGEEESDPGLVEYAAKTPARAYLAERISDPRLRRLLGSIGTHEPYSNLALLAAMWRLVSVEGIWRPEAGMRDLVDRLARAVTGSGRGEIRLGTAVSRILFDRGKVRGVELTDGSVIHAPVVISNADFKTTFLGLCEPDAMPPGLLRAVFAARLTASNLQVSLGVDKSQVDLRAFEGASRIIYRAFEVAAERGAERVDWSADRIDPEALARQEIEVSLWSADDPTAAPEGMAVVIIRTEADHAHFGRRRPTPGRRGPDYLEYKTGQARALVRRAGEVAPGLAEAVKVMDVATPLTFEERGGRSGGSVAGWSWDFEDSRDFRSREMVVTPLAGLYMAGCQAFSSLFMGGVPTAMTSGKMAADAAYDGKGPEDMELPGADE